MVRRLLHAGTTRPHCVFHADVWRHFCRDSAADSANEIALARRFLHYLDAAPASQDRKSTRLNSSHSQISYAVFCLKKKKISICTSFHIIYIDTSSVSRD